MLEAASLATVPRSSIQMIQPKYGKGGPTKRRRKDEMQEPPPGYDLTKVEQGRLVYLPGGLDRAVEEACRFRHHPMKGVGWRFEGKTICPGDWIRVQEPGLSFGWWLILLSTLDYLIIVSRDGGYRKFSRADFRVTVRAAEIAPPWWDEWVLRNLENELG